MNSLASDGVKTCNGDDNGCSNNMLSVNNGDNNSATPNTPEIINALTKINPLDDYLRHNSPTVEDRLFSPGDYSNSADTCSSNSNLGSPSSPVNVQKNMHSQFIKEELKVRLQQKARKNNAAAAATGVATTPVCVEQPVICSVLGHDDCSLDLDEYDGNSSNSETFKSSASYEVSILGFFS